MSKQRKILHVSHSLDTGGGPLYINKIVHDLSGYSHYVVGNAGYYFDLLKTEIGADNVRLLRGKNLFLNMLVIQKIINEEGITVIHCHGRGAGLYTRLLKPFNKRIKIVYTLHGFHPETVRWIFRKLYIFVEWLFTQITDQIILLSPSEYSRFTSNVGNFPGKLTLIPNYLRQAEFSPTRLDLPLDRHYAKLVFVGRFSHEKGIDLVVEAMIGLADLPVRLYLIGYGSMDKWVAETIRRHSLEDKVIVIGKRNQASQFLPNFDAIVIPSRFEGMPFIVLESMLYKMPIICTPSVGIMDLVSQDTAFVSEGFSSEDISLQIVKFLQLRTNGNVLLNEMIQKNHTKLISQYSDANIEKIDNVYNKISV